MTKTLYKAFVTNVAGEPCFLFHGLGGSKTVPLDMWITAENKTGRDGTSNTYYETAFHVLPDEDAVRHWAKSLTHAKVIARVEIRGRQRIKGHSKHRVILADKIYLSQEAWDQRQVLLPENAHRKDYVNA